MNKINFYSYRKMIRTYASVTSSKFKNENAEMIYSFSFLKFLFLLPLELSRHVLSFLEKRDYHSLMKLRKFKNYYFIRYDQFLYADDREQYWLGITTAMKYNIKIIRFHEDLDNFSGGCKTQNANTILSDYIKYIDKCDLVYRHTKKRNVSFNNIIRSINSNDVFFSRKRPEIPRGKLIKDIIEKVNILKDSYQSHIDNELPLVIKKLATFGEYFSMEYLTKRYDLSVQEPDRGAEECVGDEGYDDIKEINTRKYSMKRCRK